MSDERDIVERLESLDWPWWTHRVTDEAADEIRRLRAEVESLNSLLREVGWGQGEIDSSATIAEENERLREEVERLRKELESEKRVMRRHPKHAHLWNY